MGKNNPLDIPNLIIPLNKLFSKKLLKFLISFNAFRKIFYSKMGLFSEHAHKYYEKKLDNLLENSSNLDEMYKKYTEFNQKFVQERYAGDESFRPEDLYKSYISRTSNTKDIDLMTMAIEKKDKELLAIFLKSKYSIGKDYIINAIEVGDEEIIDLLLDKNFTSIENFSQDIFDIIKAFLEKNDLDNIFDKIKKFLQKNTEFTDTDKERSLDGIILSLYNQKENNKRTTTFSDEKNEKELQDLAEFFLKDVMNIEKNPKKYVELLKKAIERNSQKEAKPSSDQQAEEQLKSHSEGVNQEMVRQLLNLVLYKNLDNKMHIELLFLAISSQNSEIVDMILDQEKQDGYKTIFSEAVRNGEIGIIQAFLNRDLYENLNYITRIYSLSSAISSGKSKIVDMILNQEKKDGCKVIFVEAARLNDMLITEYLLNNNIVSLDASEKSNQEMIKQLLDPNLYKNLSYRVRTELLSSAISSQNSEMTNMILDQEKEDKCKVMFLEVVRYGKIAIIEDLFDPTLYKDWDYKMRTQSLSLAILSQNSKVIDMILDQEKQDGYKTIFIEAARYSEISTIRYLVENKLVSLDVSKKSNQQMIKQLLDQNFYKNLDHKMRLELLSSAISSQNSEIIKEILNQEKADGYKSIFLEAIRCNEIPMIRYLSKKFWAGRITDQQMLRKLLDTAIYKNFHYKMRVELLSSAISSKNSEVIKMILNQEKADGYKNIFLEAACTPTTFLYNPINIIQYLIDNKMMSSDQDEIEKSAFALALPKGSLEIAHFFYEKGIIVDVDKITKRKATYYDALFTSGELKRSHMAFLYEYVEKGLFQPGIKVRISTTNEDLELDNENIIIPSLLANIKIPLKVANLNALEYLCKQYIDDLKSQYEESSDEKSSLSTLVKLATENKAFSLENFPRSFEEFAEKIRYYKKKYTKLDFVKLILIGSSKKEQQDFLKELSEEFPTVKMVLEVFLENKEDANSEYKKMQKELKAKFNEERVRKDLLDRCLKENISKLVYLSKEVKDRQSSENQVVRNLNQSVIREAILRGFLSDGPIREIMSDDEISNYVGEYIEDNFRQMTARKTEILNKVNTGQGFLR